MTRALPSSFRRRCASALLVALMLSACTPATTGDTSGGTRPVAALRAFDSCDALTAELRRRGLAQVSAEGIGVPPGLEATTDVAAARDAQAASGAAGATAAGAGDFSGTNVAEAGVDEPDVVKTDGSSVFAIADGTLRIIDVRGARPEVVATVPVADGVPRDMLLHEGRVLLLGDDALAPAPDPLARADRGVALRPMLSPRTRLWSVDVGDPGAPAVVSTMTVDGALLTARMTDGMARVVVRSLPAPPDMVQPFGRDADTASALAINRRRVEQATAAEWLPQAAVDGREPAPLVDCTAVRAPERGDDLGLVSVLSVDLDRADLDTQRVDAVLGGADTVYADADTLYVTTSRWPVALPVEPAAATATTMATPAPRSTVTTEVHRFDLDPDGGATYVASGTVPGTVLNQWALSEHDDALRIAITVDDGGPSHSAVHILRTEDARLVEVGRTGDLGRGERIYAVRYAGALGFVVTFRQVDPLYTLDLSDPYAPSVLGELKIPGYSAYLHPIGADHLLGIGQDADADGRVTGLQVSLFDVSDLRAPVRVGRIGAGPQTSSPVEYDHHALLIWPDRDLVVLPVERWDTGGSGVLVLTADDEGHLTERGTVALPEGSVRPGAPLRTLVVGDRLVTVSSTVVLTSDLDTLAPLGSARL